MQFPKKAKFRKWQTKRRNNAKRPLVASRGMKVSFGSHGLQSRDTKRITANQIEAARRAARRAISKHGKIWIRIFPDRPYTQKPAEVKMGKGKGAPVGYQAQVETGRIMFEVDGVADEIAREALRKAGAKLPVRTKIITRT